LNLETPSHKFATYVSKSKNDTKRTYVSDKGDITI